MELKYILNESKFGDMKKIDFFIKLSVKRLYIEGYFFQNNLLIFKKKKCIFGPSVTIRSMEEEMTYECILNSKKKKVSNFISVMVM